MGLQLPGMVLPFDGAAISTESTDLHLLDRTWAVRFNAMLTSVALALIY